MKTICYDKYHGFLLCESACLHLNLSSSLEIIRLLLFFKCQFVAWSPLTRLVRTLTCGRNQFWLECMHSIPKSLLQVPGFWGAKNILSCVKSAVRFFQLISGDTYIYQLMLCSWSITRSLSLENSLLGHFSTFWRSYINSLFLGKTGFKRVLNSKRSRYYSWYIKTVQ